MTSRAFHALGALTSISAALFMSYMAYEFGFMPDGFFEEAALGPFRVWIIVMLLSALLILLGAAHLRSILHGRSAASSQVLA